MHRILCFLLRLLTLLLACFLVTTGSTGADELVCPSLNLSTARNDTPPRQTRGLLWRVVKPGIPPSYLFGTIHLGDQELTTLPAPVSSVFDQSRHFVMESTLDAENLEQWAQTIVSSHGGSLRDQLGSALFERSVSLLSRYGIPAGTADRMKPWAVYLTLSLPPAQAGLPLDLALAMRAERAGKPVSGLETVGEQVDIVARLPSEDQAALVKDAVCYYDALQEDIRAMKRLYLDRDLAGLVAAANRYELMETPRYQRLMQQLLWDRNERLLQRMAGYLKQGEAFIALGALHLPGERGLLTLLERAGYTVEPVY